MLIRKALNRKLCFSVTKIITFTLLDIILASSQFFWCTFGHLQELTREFPQLLSDIVLLPLQGSMCSSQIAHAAGMQTLIFLDRGWPDPPRLTFTATHTLQSHEEERLKPSRFQNTSGLRRSSQRVISRMFTNTRYFKNVKFAIIDTKTCVISKSDLSAAATESRHTLVVWPFC